jgi:hypothetical protein
MATWVDEYTTMIDDCEKRESQLTDWERGFIDSLRDWLGRGKPLTPKQTEALERVWERVTASG